MDVDLGAAKTVSGVVTQGRKEEDQWIKLYRVEYSQDKSSWSMVGEFDGNSDRSTKKENHFSPVTARYVRFKILDSHGHESARFGVLACEGPPTCSDGLQNQGETGVDCGGPCNACNTPDMCDIVYTFSPSPMSTSIECNCKSCNFQPTDVAETMFESDCEKCDCVQQLSSQCLDNPGTPAEQRVFSSDDKHYLMTWGLAGDFFEGPYCHYAGCHPRTTCKKLRCEAFGSKEDADCYTLNKDEFALEQMLSNKTADMNHPGLQDPNLGEWRDDFSWVNKRKRTDPFDPDAHFCKALHSLMMSHVYFETGFVPFSNKEETAEADLKLESDADFIKFDSWSKNPQFKHRSHCVKQYWSETLASEEPELEAGPQPTSLLQSRANVMDKMHGKLDRVAGMMRNKGGVR